MGVRNLRYLTKILMITVCLIALSGIAAACDSCVECKTFGYWKAPCLWPVESIHIGGITYTKYQAIDIICHPVRYDKTYAMFNALVTAKLNVKSGCCPSSEVEDAIWGADRWLEVYKLGSGVTVSSDAWKKEFVYCSRDTYPSGEDMFKKLDAFNNGY